MKENFTSIKSMTGKDFIKMLGAMFIVLIILLFTFGWFSIGVFRMDIIDPVAGKTIGASENWEFSARNKEGRFSYFIYTGEGKAENVSVKGNMYYGEEVGGNKKNYGDYQVEEKLLPRRHFVIGKKRWYSPSTGSDILMDLCVQIVWEKDGKAFSEYLVSEDLSEEEVERVKQTLAE